MCIAFWYTLIYPKDWLLGTSCYFSKGGTQQIFIRGGSTPKVQPLTLLYVIFHEKGTPFVYLILRNHTPFSYLL